MDCLIFSYFFSYVVNRILMVVFSYVGIEFSSPVLASAMSNIIPGLTFMVAVIIRFLLFSLLSRH